MTSCTLLPTEPSLIYRSNDLKVLFCLHSFSTQVIKINGYWGGNTNKKKFTSLTDTFYFQEKKKEGNINQLNTNILMDGEYSSLFHKLKFNTFFYFLLKNHPNNAKPMHQEIILIKHSQSVMDSNIHSK